MIDWQLLAAIGGGIVLAGNVGTAIYKWIKPAIDLKSDVTTLKQEMEEFKEHEKNDFKTLHHMQEMSKLQCRAMLCMMNHMIDGNNVDDMKETREKIQDLLIKL